MYFTYILRCEDNSLYTGITTDLDRRMEEHFSKGEKCAKYTYRHTPKKLEAAWKSETRAIASKLEFNIKRLTKQQKEDLVAKKETIRSVLSEKVDSKLYRRVILKKKIGENNEKGSRKI